MFEYGNKVKYVRTGKIGDIIGFMRGEDKYLVKFAGGESELWIPGRELEKVKLEEAE